MIDWSKYFLTKNPFLAVPAIKITSKDIKANGKLYYSKFAEKEISKMSKMIKAEEFPLVFLTTEGPTLGNGKSAFFAHIYWKLKEEGSNVLWATARDDPRLRNLLAGILDSFLDQLLEIKESISPITTANIRKYLVNAPRQYSSSIIQALKKILEQEDDKIIYSFSTIKRRIPPSYYDEVFGAILNLAYGLGEKRFTIFIDQFEEYILSHNTQALRTKLGHELNDLQREIGDNTTLAVSTHPEATDAIISSAPEAETFIRVDVASTPLPKMTTKDLLAMIAKYLEEFRPLKYDDSRYHPFDEDFILYAAERADLNPRSLIIALRTALLYGAMNNFPKINEDFIQKNHKNVFGGLEDKWKEFKNGTWKYEIR